MWNPPSLGVGSPPKYLWPKSKISYQIYFNNKSGVKKVDALKKLVDGDCEHDFEQDIARNNSDMSVYERLL